jgi:hypothetical protein
MLDRFFINDDEAIEAGFTHKATLHGVSVYVGDIGNEAPLVACKFMPFLIYLTLIDWAVDFMMLFVSEQQFYEMPYKNIEKLEAKNGL